MVRLARSAHVAVLIMLCWAAFGIASAQDEPPTTIVGSGIAAQVFAQLLTSSSVDLALQYEARGTTDGLARLCTNTADVALASRAITADEHRQCVDNAIDYTELLIAHEIAALIVPDAAAYAECLGIAEMNGLLAPSSQITNWNQLSAANADAPISIAVPGIQSTAYAIIDALVEGDGLRTDQVQSLSSAADVVNAVSSGEATLGVVSLPALTDMTGVRIVSLSTSAAGTCQEPNIENVEQRLYNAEQPLYVYLNQDALIRPRLQAALSYAISDDARPILAQVGLVAPTQAVAELNSAALTGTGNTRPFSEATASYQIPPDASGQLQIAGSAVINSLVSNLSSTLTALYPGITPDIKLAGETAGVRRLCNGEVGLVSITNSPTPEQQENCAANGVNTLEIPIGRQAVILVANASSNHLSCLTTEAIRRLWAADATPAITWDQASTAFPAEPITLLAPEEGSSTADLLLATSGGVGLVERSAVGERNDDPRYRAAAVANVSGAITYMTWAEYQSVVESQQTNVKLVGVDSDEGCILPSEESIASGAYPLSRPSAILVNTARLDEVPIQAFLWLLVSDENYPLREQQEFYGVNFGSLPALRESLQAAFIDAEQAAAAELAAPTLAPTPEVTATPAS